MGYTNLFYLCPYFVRDDKMAISCEGKTTIRFPSPDLCRRHKGNYCAGDWQQCQYAQMLNEFYDGKGEEHEDRSDRC